MATKITKLNFWKMKMLKPWFFNVKLLDYARKKLTKNAMK